MLLECHHLPPASSVATLGSLVSLLRSWCRGSLGWGNKVLLGLRVASGSRGSRAILVNLVTGGLLRWDHCVSFIGDISHVTVLVSCEADDLDTGVWKKNAVLAGSDCAVRLLAVRVIVAEFGSLDGPVEVVGHTGTSGLLGHVRLGSSLKIALEVLLSRSLILLLLLLSSLLIPTLLGTGGAHGDQNEQGNQLESHGVSSRWMDR